MSGRRYSGAVVIADPKSRFALRRRTLTGVPVALCLAALFALVASGCGRSSSSQAAVVDGTVIPVSQLKAAVSAKLGASSSSTSSTAQDMIAITQQSLEGLIQFQIVLDAAKREGITVTDEAVETQVNRVKAQAQQQGATYEALLAQNGLTDALYREQVRVQLAVNSVATKLVPYKADDVLLQVMNQHKSDYLELHVRHVLVKDQKTANTVHDQLVKTGDWSGVAKKYSIDPGSKTKGGDLGYESKTGVTDASANQFVAEFERAAYALASQGGCKDKTSGSCASPISAPVKSQYGYHVIQVTGVRLPQLTDDLRTKLDTSITTRRQSAIDTWFKGLLKNAAVTVNPRYGKWDAASGHVVDRSTAPNAASSSSSAPPVTS